MRNKPLTATLCTVLIGSLPAVAVAQANHNTARSNKSTVAAPSGGEDHKTAAHEAAHVVQQRGGGSGGVNAHAHQGDHAAPAVANQPGAGSTAESKASKDAKAGSTGADGQIAAQPAGD